MTRRVMGEETRIMVNVGVGSRAEFLARVQRFTDMVLERLGEASEGRDVDEKEARMLGSLALKVLRLWDKALLSEQRDPQLEDEMARVRKKVAEANKGEA